MGAMSEDVGRLIAMTVFLPLDEEKLEVELRKLHTLCFFAVNDGQVAERVTKLILIILIFISGTQRLSPKHCSEKNIRHLPQYLGLAEVFLLPLH